MAFNMFCLTIPPVTAEIEKQITQYEIDLKENHAVRNSILETEKLTF